jgi:hypothetical protein
MEANDTQTQNGPDFSSLRDFAGQDIARKRNMSIGVVHAASNIRVHQSLAPINEILSQRKYAISSFCMLPALPMSVPRIEPRSSSPLSAHYTELCQLPEVDTTLRNRKYKGLQYLYFFKFVGVGRDWVHLVPRSLFGPLYQPRMIDDECEAVGGMRIGRVNRSTRRKPAPVTLCPPQNPHDLGANPGSRAGKPVTNRLSYDKAFNTCKFYN